MQPDQDFLLFAYVLIHLKHGMSNLKNYYCMLHVNLFFRGVVVSLEILACKYFHIFFMSNIFL